MTLRSTPAYSSSSSFDLAVTVGRQAAGLEGVARERRLEEEDEEEDEEEEESLLDNAETQFVVHRGLEEQHCERRPGHAAAVAPCDTGDEEECQELLEQGGERRSPRASAAGALPTAVCCAGATVAGVPRAEAQPSPAWVVLLVCGHAISASLLLVVNKWALQGFPFVWVLTTLQFVPAALVVGIAGATGAAEVDALRFRKLVAFMPAAGMFFVTMTAGNAVVKHANVDTFIVMRSLVPIPCAFLETLALGEPCPRPVSWLGLCTLLLGALCYADANQGVAIRSASWMLLFLVMMPIDAVLIKHLINTSGLSPWGLVLYQNLLAGGLGLACTLILELRSSAALGEALGSLGSGGPRAWLPLALSCLLGVSVSFFQMNVRKVMSSTAFMVLGVSNKLLALLINQLAMEANGSFMSIASVLLSIGGAVGFQQTVKGRGISQAPGCKGENQGGSVKAFLAMLAGLAWAGMLSASENPRP